MFLRFTSKESFTSAQAKHQPILRPRCQPSNQTWLASYLKSYGLAEYKLKNYDMLFECAKNTKAVVIDLRPQMWRLEPEFFFIDYLHFRSVGVNWLIDQVEKEIGKVFRKKI